MPNKPGFDEALKVIFDGIDRLQKICGNHRSFTIDGRLVGDLGEIIAEQEFDIVLDAKSRKLHDAKTTDGRDVQIKATFQDSLTFGREPVLYLGLKLYRDGRHEVIFNGPGNVLSKAFAHRKGIGETLLSFPLAKMKELSKAVEETDRVPTRIAR